MAGSIYAELVAFSETLQPWQRDALRRHTTSKTLSPADVSVLTDIAYEASLKKEQALEEREGKATTFENPAVVPLSQIHVPSSSTADPPVALSKVRHLDGVNRLRAGTDLTLNPTGLNIVFGLNGVGKSGYTRILKSCCHAKTKEIIKGDIFLERKPEPRAKVQYQVGDNALEHEWNPQAESDNSDLSRVAVYDSHTASVHVGKNPTEMSYTPAGLDLIRGLTTTYGAVAQETKSRIAGLNAQSIPTIFTDAVSPPVRTALDSLGKIGAPNRLNQIGSLSTEERHELSDLPAAIAAIKTKSKLARHRQAKLESANYRNQGNRIRTLSERVSHAQIDALKTAWLRLRQIETELAVEIVEDFSNEPVPGVLSPHWKEMWHAVKDFTLTEQESEREFLSDETERCPFCQQLLSEEAWSRLHAFKHAMEKDLGTEQQRLEQRTSQIVTAIRDAVSSDNINADMLLFLKNDHPNEVEELEQLLALARALITVSTGEQLESEESIGALTSPFLIKPGVEPNSTPTVEQGGRESAQLFEKIATEHDATAELIENESDDGLELASKEARYSELAERDKVEKNLGGLHDYHNRLVHIRALERVVTETTTRALSTKSRTLIADYAARIAEEFTTNLRMFENLSDSVPETEGRLRVNLVPSVKKSVNNIHFTMDGAADSKETANGVLSEGELRAVSVAAFLADVTTSDDDSAIIFDDPMNSLDHDFQRRIAVRLAEEARRRQVIIFTHSMSFVGALWHEGVQKSYRRQVQQQVPNPTKVEATYIEMTRHPELGAGIQLGGSGTPTRGFKNLLAHLENAIIPKAREHHSGENEDLQAYSDDCVTFASNLRNAWEYAVEEIIIGGVVARNQPDVRTGMLTQLLALTPEDVAAVDEGMDVNSYYVHSTGDDSQVSLPTPRDMLERVQSARDWLKDFNKRKDAQRS